MLRKKGGELNNYPEPIPIRYTAVYAAAAIAFMVLLAVERTGIIRTILKAIPVSVLILLVLFQLRGHVRLLLTGALLGSVCGDIFLDLPYNGLFIYGLAAFLVAHLLYLVLFFRHAAAPGGFEKAIIAGLVVFALAMAGLFRGIDPSIYGPVVLYIGVIVAMSIGALLVPAPTRLLFWGALLFIVSDVVLAVNKFLIPIPYGRLFNITLYFISQYVIIMAARSIWGRVSRTGREKSQ